MAKRRQAKAGVGPKQAVVISDTHFGCQLGLCPPEGMRLDGGGRAMPSPLQAKVWAMWEEFWRDIVPLWVRGEPYYLILNGDCIEGVHHRAVTQMSHNIEDQKAIAVEVLRPVVQKAHSYYHIRGTEAHVGPSAQHEEAVAKALGAVPDEFGNHARWELYKRIGGALAHFTHHIGTTSSTAYESSAPMRELGESFVEAGRWRKEPPQVIVRSHRHRNIEIRVPTEYGYGIAVVTPAWQLKTPFVFKLGSRQSQPQIGGIFIRWGDEDGIYTRSHVWGIERPREE